tara:strand:- start:19974 stop:20852 length:879 start_codon:yes stop_codon:yes gene_type:complete
MLRFDFDSNAEGSDRVVHQNHILTEVVIMIKEVVAHILLLGLLLSPSVVVAEEFTYDFAHAEWEPLVFRPIGTKAGHPGKQTEEGVVLIAPNEKSKKSQVGYATRFAVKGDFEITVGYKLLETPRPEKGYGSGLMIKLFKTDNERINFSRSLKTDGEHKLSTAMWIKKKDVWTPLVERVPAEQDYGELKIVRKNATVTFFVKEGEALEFKELRQVQFGPQPLQRIEILADTGGDQQPLKILLTRLTMNADEMLDSAAPPPVVKTFWTTWTITGTAIAVILVLLGSFIWYQRR